MTKTTKALIARFTSHTAKVAKTRDALRTQLADMQAIVDSLDDGCCDLDDAIRNFEDAIDTLSQYV